MCSYRVTKNKGAENVSETMEACASNSTRPEHHQEEDESEESNSEIMLFEPQTVTCTEETSPMVSSSLLLYGNEAMTSLQDVVPGLTWEELMAIYAELVSSPTV